MIDEHKSVPYIKLDIEIPEGLIVELSTFIGDDGMGEPALADD